MKTLVFLERKMKLTLTRGLGPTTVQALSLSSFRHSRVIRRVLLFLLGALCASAFGSSAFAQGCAMCYTSAEAAGPAAQRSLDVGILVLLVPTLLMFIGIVVLAVRRAGSTS